jgi:hypothetical protein
VAKGSQRKLLSLCLQNDRQGVEVMALSRTVYILGAALALAQGQIAHAADNCLTEAEVGGLVGYALPSVINGTMKACKPHLSANGFFATRGATFAGQYAARKDANWPIAKNAFLKLGSTKDASMNNTLKARRRAATFCRSDGFRVGRR